MCFVHFSECLHRFVRRLLTDVLFSMVNIGREHDMVKLILVDDEQLFLNSLAKYIAAQMPDFEICGCFHNGKEALAYMQKHEVDILITDVNMPEMDGLALVREAFFHFPNCTAVILSGYSEFEYARTAIKYHVSQYLLKPVDYRELKSCLEELRKNRLHTNPAPAQTAASNPAADSRVPRNETAHSSQIQKSIQYIHQNYAKDLSRDSLAAALFISPSYFSIQFKKEMGVSFMEYLTKIRITVAIELLKTNLRINDIAERVGYRNRNRFIINFREITGYTPSEYRKKVLSMEEPSDE